MSSAHIAIDLGAESGRVVVVSLAEGSYELHEIHRFPNAALRLPSGLHWDITSLWREIVNGLTTAARWAVDNDIPLNSISVDTWGVDWALLGKSGELISLPHAYRDDRNAAAFQQATEIVTVQEIYQATGIQIMAINSLFSVYAQCRWGPETIEAANRLVFLPDLFHYWLSGVVRVENTVASTSQIMDVRIGQWSERLLSALSIKRQLFGDTVEPGTVIGPILNSVATDTGLDESIQVIATASHDTASAVAAVPGEEDTRWCFLSSGTWSLLGAEIDEPCITDDAQSAMFTNELGVGGKVRFLKNIAGLWLIQQCRRDFALRDQTYDYAELAELAALAEPFRTIIDPDDPAFQGPGNMLEKIDSCVEQSEQPHPETPGDYLRCCLESLALAYRQTLHKLETVLELEFEVIHIVGGGGRNDLLNQMTSSATGRRVVVGPFEATATGNALVQSMALGNIRDLAELRRIVRNSVELTEYEPADQDLWDAAFDRFIGLTLSGRS